MIRYILPLLALSGWATDEPIAAYAPTGVVGQLEQISGEGFPAKATILVGMPGSVAGNAPCNSYSAAQTAPYPWIEIGQIAATKRACPGLAAEVAFFDMLGRVSIAEVSETTLILSTDDGAEMVFTPQSGG
jgi:heat shock protein HslJ